MVDLSEREESGVFLEGTGSVVFDHVARAAYACLSPRTDERTFREVIVVYRVTQKVGLVDLHLRCSIIL